jgi:hypothetical protein
VYNDRLDPCLIEKEQVMAEDGRCEVESICRVVDGVYGLLIYAKPIRA